MRPLRVVLADGGSDSRARLLSVAERANLEIVGEALDWSDVASLAATRSADLILISGDADFAEGVMAVDGRVGSIIIAPDAVSTKEYTRCGAYAIVTPDTDPDLVTSLASIAVARAREMGVVRDEANDLRHALETRKVVERAKGVLMQRLGIAEDAAYRRMQRASQQENRKMREIAESILSAERLYGGEETES